MSLSSNTVVIAQREYLARVRSLGFWIATVALPLLIAIMGIVPSLLLLQQDATHRLVVVDATGRLGEAIAQELGRGGGLPGEGAGFEIELLSDAPREELNRRVLEGEIDSWVRIDEESLEQDRLTYYAESVSNFLTQQRIERAASAAVRTARLRDAGYDAEEVGRLARPLRLSPVKVTEKGETGEGVAAGIILAYFLFFTLYMVLVLYGQQVMNGVLEEKSSRIVEVIVSTVRPIELMLGKLIGICSAALTQLAVWVGTVVVLTLPSIADRISWLPEGVTLPTFSPYLLAHLLINFFLGFFLFSTLYAAIGSAFNSVQEAQHFAGAAIFFMVAPVLLFWKVLNDPDGMVSVVASMVPLFTPLLMMLRIAVKMPPAWQIAVAYALTAAFTWTMIWVCARIYRVGILMYGKKPSLQELWRWVRYT